MPCGCAWNRTAGGGYCARRLVIGHGVNVESHTSSGPAFNTRGDAGATDDEAGDQQSFGCRRVSQRDGIIYSWTRRRIRICHNGDISKDSAACERCPGGGWRRMNTLVWGTVLERLAYGRCREKTETYYLMIIIIISKLIDSGSFSQAEAGPNSSNLVVSVPYKWTEM